MIRGSAVFFAALLLTGCVQPHSTKVQAIDLALPPSCVIGPIVLLDCDINSDPPKCKTTRIAYKHGCETVTVHK